MSAIDSCPFCAIDGSRTLAEDELTATYLDGFPDSPGHTLIPPRPYIATLFEVTEVAQTALLQVLTRAKVLLAVSHHPDGYSIGINHGEAAGQTIGHLHIHLIPSYRGSQDDHRGSIRWIFPEKARYRG